MKSITIFIFIFVFMNSKAWAKSKAFCGTRAGTSGNVSLEDKKGLEVITLGIQGGNPFLAEKMAKVLEAGRAALLSALKAHHILVPGEKLLRVVYVCSVQLGKARLPVIDILEQESEAREPRQIDQVILFSPQLVPIQKIRIFKASPLFCKANQIYFSGHVRIADGSSGNVMQFKLGGAYIKMKNVDPMKFPVPLGK